jgi:hypothetical protein
LEIHRPRGIVALLDSIEQVLRPKVGVRPRERGGLGVCVVPDALVGVGGDFDVDPGAVVFDCRYDTGQ